jgi:predicted nucleic acid-binding Zn ribbon protein
MAEKVGQHTHCNMCGKAIPLSETLCSDECRKKFNTMVKKRKTLVYIMYFFIFVILALFLVTTMTGGY